MAAASSFIRLSPAGLLATVLAVLTAAVTLPAAGGAEISVVTLFQGPGCTGNAQMLSGLGACHNVSASAGGGVRVGPLVGGVLASLYTSANCSDGSLVGVLRGAVTRAAGGLLGAVANATGGGLLGGIVGAAVAGADGTSFLFCNGSLAFQSIKLQAVTN